MKKFISKLLLVSMLAAPAVVFAEKVGVVNVNQLLSEYAEAKGLNKMHEAHFEKPKAEVEKLIEEIKKIEKEIKTNELLMTEVKLTMLKKKLNTGMQEYRVKVAAMEKEFKTMRNKEVGEFKKVLFGVTKTFAAEKKYDLILNQEMVFFSTKKMSVTKQLSDRLKKEIK